MAALLARMEAGSRSRDSARFGSILRSFEREHERAAAAGAQVEVVDLTRSQVRGFGSLLPRKKVTAS